jgi:hypothetical protein
MCEVSIRFVPSFPLQCFPSSCSPASVMRIAQTPCAVGHLCRKCCLARGTSSCIFGISTYTFDFVSRLERVGSSLQTQFRTRMTRTHIPHLLCPTSVSYPLTPLDRTHQSIVPLRRGRRSQISRAPRRCLLRSSLLSTAVLVHLALTVLRYSPLHARPAFLCALPTSHPLCNIQPRSNTVSQPVTTRPLKQGRVKILKCVRLCADQSCGTVSMLWIPPPEIDLWKSVVA